MYENCGTKQVCNIQQQNVVQLGLQNYGTSTPDFSSRSLIKETLEMSFLRFDSRCRRYVSDLPHVAPRYFGLAQKGSGLLFRQISNSRFSSLLLKWKVDDNVLDALNFSFHLWKYAWRVDMSWLKISSSV